MTIKKLTWLFSVFTFGLLVVLLIAASIMSNRTAEEHQRMQVAAQVLRQQGLSDMMHDALRGQVYQALYNSSQGQANRAADLADLERYSTAFQSSINDEMRNVSSPATTRRLRRLQQPINLYLDQARSIVTLAYQDRDAAEQQLPAFQRSFRALEQSMGEATEAIDSDFVAAADAAGAINRGFSWFRILLLAGVLLAVGGIVFLLVRHIVQPLGSLADALDDIQADNLDVFVPGTHRSDEIGDLARAVADLRDATLRANDAQAQQLAAQQELAAQREGATERRKAAMVQFADTLEEQIGTIVQLVSAAGTDLQMTAQSMSAVAEQTIQQAAVVAGAAQQASSNVTLVAGAGDELNASIAEINRQVISSTEIARATADDARKVDETVKGLLVAVEEVGQISGMIASIADQTNLLALNATIEAARAGEAGRGFAVVANEVKTLADQTSKSTADVSALVASMQAASEQSSRAIEIILKRISELEQVSVSVASAVDQQSLASEEVARSIAQAAQGTEMVSTNIGEVNEAARTTGTAANQVLVSSEELQHHANQLSVQMTEYVERLRAA
jgi:methyl-accepting chemotaxis protein